METAATRWLKYDPNSLGSPKPYNWCLWTLVIDGERNYFAGSIIEQGGKQFINWAGFTSFDIDSTLYYAHVIPLKNQRDLKKEINDH